MVEYNSDQLDRVFAAVSDPTRRRIIDQLRDGELTVNEIAEEHSMSLAAVSKHLKVLEKAGLLNRKKQGRSYHCAFNPRAMQEAADWMAQRYAFWNMQFDSLEEFFAKGQQDKQ